MRISFHKKSMEKFEKIIMLIYSSVLFFTFPVEKLLQSLHAYSVFGRDYGKKI